MISFERVSKAFSAAGGPALVIRSVSFSIKAGAFVTMFGPNGCGKSTLMNMLGGTETLSGGRIAGLEAIRRQIGFVFQDYRRTLLPWLNAEQNILFPLKLRGLPDGERKRRLETLIEITRPDFRMIQPIHTLSGGQAQLVALMRALIIDPKLLILDEPFSSLDFMRTLHMREKLAEIARRLGLSVLCISHDLEDALFLGDQLVVLSRPPTHVVEVLQVPFPRPRTAALLASPAFLELKARVLRSFLASLGEVQMEGFMERAVQHAG